MSAIEAVSLESGERQEIAFTYVLDFHEDEWDLRPLSATFEHGVRTADDYQNATITIVEPDEEDDDDRSDPEPKFEVSGYSGTQEAMWGEMVTISARVRNTGIGTGETEVVAFFGGDKVANTSVRLGPGEWTTVTFSKRVPVWLAEGSYSVRIRASEGGDSAGGSVYVYLPDNMEPEGPTIQGSTSRLCLAILSGEGCWDGGSQRRSLTGHYGAAATGLMPEHAPAFGVEDSDRIATERNRSAASRSLSLPDAESIPVQVRVRAETAGEGDHAEIVLETDSKTYTVFSRADGASTDGWVTVSTDVWALAGQNVDVIVRTEGSATVEVDYVSIMPDSTDDGVPDAVEEMDLGMPVGLEGVRGTPLGLDPTTADTTGDGLTDAGQVDIEWDIDNEDGTWQVTAEAVEAVAHPARNDTDGDGVTDVKEVNGWTVNVVNKTSGKYAGEDPFRWDSGQSLKPDETEGEVRFYADPLQPDTSGNGVDDYTEKEVLHTDPRAEQTYGITVKHQEEIVDELVAQYNGEDSSAQPAINNLEGAVGLLRIGGVQSPRDLQELELNDTTDDFAFVTNEEGGLPFVGHDYTHNTGYVRQAYSYRTDTWLTNREVLAYRDTHDVPLLPWDPDSDDDGLTDGQEIHGVTEFLAGPQIGNLQPSGVELSDGAVSPDGSIPYEDLDPVDPDSDGDGWWDGWIGVYGAGYNSENVILYMDHLRTGDGVEGYQTVPEQAGVHKVRYNGDPDTEVAPAAMAVDLYNDSWTYHSNLHLGELHWRTDPSDDGENPSPELTVEVDFYEGANTSMNTPEWEHGIERNFALYGIDLDIIHDETITEEQMENLWLVNPDNGFGITEIDDVSDTFWDQDTDEYVVVLTYANSLVHPEFGRDQSGFNNPLNGHIAIFAEGHSDYANDVERYHQSKLQNSSYQTGMGMTTAKTLIHEFGHSFKAGEADDDMLEHPLRLGEVYSGSPDDSTPENIQLQERWSIMSSGWGTRLVIQPMNGSYFAFSIEEVSTIKE